MVRITSELVQVQSIRFQVPPSEDCKIEIKGSWRVYGPSLPAARLLHLVVQARPQ